MVQQTPHSAPVLENHTLSPHHHLLVVDGSSGAAREYVRPGQYALLGLPDLKAQPFAYCASPRLDGRLSFFYRVQSPLTEGLAQLKKGDVLQVGDPAGPGFPYEEAKNHHALLVGVGTGIAPLRSLAEFFLETTGKTRSITLVYGAQTEEHIAFDDDLEKFQEAGAKVHLAISRPANDGKKQWVQHLLPDALTATDETVVFLCGHQAMEEGVRAELADHGVNTENIHRNY